MNVISRFAFKSLKNNRKWTIVTVIGIIISTAMITAVFTLSASFINMMQRFTIEDTGNYHSAFFNAKAKDIAYIRDDKYTDDIMVTRSVGYAKLENSQNRYKPYLYIEQYDDNSMKYFPIHLISGRLPENDKEIVIPQHIETNGGVKFNLGDKLKLAIGKRKLPDGKILMQNEHLYYSDEKGAINEEFISEGEAEYTVVGIMERPGFESRLSPGYTVITYLDNKALLPDTEVDIYMLSKKLDNNIDDRVYNVADKIGLDKSNVGLNIVLLRFYGIIENDEARNIVFIFSLITIIIIMAASVSLIYNAFAISVSERVKQLGMLASVGATKKQKCESIYYEGLAVGIIGIPLGIISGLIGIGITIKLLEPMINGFINTSHVGLNMIVSPKAILYTALFAALTIFISVYMPAKRASKIMPIDAIRQSKEIKMTSKNIKTPWLVKALFGLEGELALKNLKRSRKKYRATIISLSISIVLFLSVSTITEYTKKSAEIRLDTENINFDVMIRLNDSSNEKRLKAFNNIISLDLVEDYGFIRELNGSSLVSEKYLPDLTKKMIVQEKDGGFLYNVCVTAIGEDAFKKYVASIGGRAEDYGDPSNPKFILVNKNVSYLENERKYIESEAIRLKEGESINFKGSSSNIQMKIEKITDKMPIGTYSNQYGNILLVTSDIIYDSIKDSNKSRESDIALALKTADGEKLDTQINEIFKENNVYDSNMMNISVDAKMQKRVSIVMSVFIYGFITLICLICIANIFNTVSTNLALRRKEFAMLRSVGMTPESFKKMMNFESVFYGIKALMYGLPISAAIGFYLYNSLNNMISFPFRLPWRDYGIAIALVFIIVSATMLYSGAKLRKQNIIDALKDDSY